MTPTLCTIGYEQHRTPDSLIAALESAGVERLLDARELRARGAELVVRHL